VHIVDRAEAVCIPLAYLTAFQMLTRYRLLPGATILVIGASGTVGTALLDLARHLGLKAICSAAVARCSTAPPPADWCMSRAPSSRMTKPRRRPPSSGFVKRCSRPEASLAVPPRPDLFGLLRLAVPADPSLSHRAPDNWVAKSVATSARELVTIAVTITVSWALREAQSQCDGSRTSPMFRPNFPI
jgi:hypothetical protein